MNTENPYHSPTLLPPSAGDNLSPSNRTLWRAYFWAPAVAPIAFVGLVFLVGLVAPYLGVEINSASMLLLPAIALTVGVVSCYFVAGVIGMPIAFYLEPVQKPFTRVV
jgi:hypothetical protein